MNIFATKQIFFRLFFPNDANTAMMKRVWQHVTWKNESGELYGRTKA